MGNPLAGAIGALIGLVGVTAGAWLQGRKDHQRWLRDQKLRAAIDFIGATGDLYDHRRHLVPGPSALDEKPEWARAQDGRSSLYLLCESRPVELAETLITKVRHLEPKADDSHNEEVISLLRELVRRLRPELGAE